MVETRLSDIDVQNPAEIIRKRKKDGEYLFSEEECYRLTEIWVQRAVKRWESTRMKELERETRLKLKEMARQYGQKTTGRGKSFWVDSE